MHVAAVIIRDNRARLISDCRGHTDMRITGDRDCCCSGIRVLAAASNIVISRRIISRSRAGDPPELGFGRSQTAARNRRGYARLPATFENFPANALENQSISSEATRLVAAEVFINFY